MTWALLPKTLSTKPTSITSRSEVSSPRSLILFATPQDVSLWKDLGPKFILQVCLPTLPCEAHLSSLHWRCIEITSSQRRPGSWWICTLWCFEASSCHPLDILVQSTLTLALLVMKSSLEFDQDGDGMIENQVGPPSALLCSAHQSVNDTSRRGSLTKLTTYGQPLGFTPTAGACGLLHAMPLQVLPSPSPPSLTPQQQWPRLWTTTRTRPGLPSLRQWLTCPASLSYHSLAERAKAVYDSALWNGTYFDYDSRSTIASP